MDDDVGFSFGGPATSVNVFCPSVPLLARLSDVRTEGEAVAETAWHLTQMMVHPRQLSVLHADKPLVFLTGPYGTGKTLVLVLKALGWLRGSGSGSGSSSGSGSGSSSGSGSGSGSSSGSGRHQHHVHVVSTWDESVPTSLKIVSQLEQTAGPSATNRVHLHQFDLWKDPGAVAAAVATLVACAGEGPLHVLVDEMGPDSMYGTRLVRGVIILPA